MKGFFTAKKEKTQKKRKSCAACALYKYANTPKFKPFGNFKKKILLVAGAPTTMDDKKGRPWTGTSGRLLKKTLAKMGVDVYEDCVTVYAVRCHPYALKGKTKGVKGIHVDVCRNKVKKDIQTYQPNLILLVGDTAIKSVIGDKWKKDLGTADKWRGWQIPDRQYNAWACPIYCPTLIQQQEKFPQFESIWKKDILAALSLTNKKIPTHTDESKLVDICTTEEQIDSALDWVLSLPDFAWDIESTGLKPHNTKAHSIKCTAFATSKRAIVVPELHNKRHIRKYRQIMRSDAKKIAQNMKFEHTWVKNMYKVTVRNWWFDTMIASHLLDSRNGVSGLKFQTLVNFGVYDYDGEVSYLLKSDDEKDSNSVNKLVRIEEDPINYKKVMLYCGLDAIYTYKLAKIQMKKLWK